VLAAAGVGSRRHCEELIGEGRVEVDGQVVRRFGARVDPQKQVIKVDGKRIPARQDLLYLALNKPTGVLTAMSDDRGRPTIAGLLPGALAGPAESTGPSESAGPTESTSRLFHVGRLDYDTEGLLLLTNDGELAHRLAHPSYGVLKTYLAEVTGSVPGNLGKRLAAGIELEDGIVRADGFRIVDRAAAKTLVELTVHEGRKRVVRRMLAEAGHPVTRLVRTQFGPVRLGRLAPGTTRELTGGEIGELYSTVGL
jgi:pseudouridine synthase